MDPLSLLKMGAAVLKAVLMIPLVSKTLDNFTEGTANKIDDWVWDAVKKVLDMKLSPNVAAEILKTELDQIQAKYDALGVEEKWKMKKPRMVWSSDSEGRFVFNT